MGILCPYPRSEEAQDIEKTLNRLVVLHRVRTHTYNIDKARRVLGYNPVPDLENGIERSVKWEMQKRKEKKGDLDRS